MNTQYKKGFGFGLMSGVVTTLGLIVGLDASTGSRFVIIAGVLAIAISDSLSDAAGMHISEEAAEHKTPKKIWEATISTFFFKFLFALTFVIPFLLLSIYYAMIASIVWGLSLITVYSYYWAEKQKRNTVKQIFEHLLIAVIVIVAAYLVGKGTAMLFIY